MNLDTPSGGRRLASGVGLPLTLGVLVTQLVAFFVASLAAAGEPSPASSPSPDAAAADESPALAPGSLLPNGREALPGVLTGGQPSREQIIALAAAGYRTVVNVRGTAEPQPALADLAREVGLRYVSLPMATGEDLTREKAAVLGALLADPSATPLAIHCGTGNRAAALLAVEQAQVEGVPPEDAIAIGIAAGLTQLEGRVRELLRTPSPQ